jgi:hypothetical protein
MYRFSNRFRNEGYAINGGSVSWEGLRRYQRQDVLGQVTGDTQFGIAPLARQMPIDQNPGSERSGAEHCDQYRERAAVEIHQSRRHSQKR